MSDSELSEATSADEGVFATPSGAGRFRTTASLASALTTPINATPHDSASDVSTVSMSDTRSDVSSVVVPDNVRENIKVAIRVRPLTVREAAHETSVSISGTTVMATKKSQTFCFSFDHLFPMQSTQAQVYEEAKGNIDAFLNGFNSTIFAYGQTGTGKTHTMFGRRGIAGGKLKVLAETERDVEISKGVIPRAVAQIFSYLNQQSSKYEITCSMVEIYNEKVRDLLAGLGENLEIRQGKHGIFVSSLSRWRVTNGGEIMDLIRVGCENQIVDATDMNERSSRSHTIFQLFLTQHADTSTIRSKLNLVDLAGSEKWNTTSRKFTDKKVSELTSINRSLSNLSACVSALYQKTFVPYRNSKLTRLLQDSLGGNSRTFFVVTISPSVLAFTETVGSLRFAERAKRIRVSVTRGEELEDYALISNLRREIKRLEGELKRGAGERVRSLEERVFEYERENEALRNENMQLQSWVSHVGGASQSGGNDTALQQRVAELNRYESWLQSIPVNFDGGWAIGVKDRVVLMEKEVERMESELAKAKKMFMQDLEEARVARLEKEDECTRLQKKIDRLLSERTHFQFSAGSPVSSVAATSPRRVVEHASPHKRRSPVKKTPSVDDRVLTFLVMRKRQEMQGQL